MSHIQPSRSRYLRAATAGLLLSLGGVAMAGAGHFGPGFGDDMFRIERMADRLGLDDTQRKALQTIEDQYRERMRPYVQKMIAGHKQMRKLSKAATLDEAAVRTTAAAQSEALTELMVLRVHKRHAVREMLTPEQREKFQHRKRGRHGGPAQD